MPLNTTLHGLIFVKNKTNGYHIPVVLKGWVVQGSLRVPQTLWGRGSLTSGLCTYWSEPVRNLAALNVLCLNHPEIIPHPPPLLQSMEKLSSTKPVPGAKKPGDHYFGDTENSKILTCSLPFSLIVKIRLFKNILDEAENYCYQI